MKLRDIAQSKSKRVSLTTESEFGFLLVIFYDEPREKNSDGETEGWVYPVDTLKIGMEMVWTIDEIDSLLEA